MSIYDQMKKTTALSGGNAAFVEDMYESFLEDPKSVSENWQSYFTSITDNVGEEKSRLAVQEKFEVLSKIPKSSFSGGSDASSKQTAVNALIAAYRDSGYKVAETDPLKLRPKDKVIDLDPSYHGLTSSDMNEVFDISNLFADSKEMKLKDIISFIEDVYIGSIGSEVSHINDIEEKRWIQQRLEKFANKSKATKKQKEEILQHLVKAEGMEKYLHTRYVGQKRFSLEGGESLIPMMDRLTQRLGEKGTKEVVIGMAHRGRLNILINVLGKLPADLFAEFEGRSAIRENSAGDVKYHMGFSSDVTTPGGDLHLTLAFNPSHLEIVNPVVQGSVRARMERRKETPASGSVMGVANDVVPIQIHGDAAFANQGVIQETLQLSQVRGYRVGGTVHIIINNQIGFTTSNPDDARSSFNCSDPAKIVQAPVLHINGDDPEAVSFASEIAADYLYKFGKDIVLDLVCYRRLGHNEADEPAATQPLMYKNIRARKTTLELYSEKMIKESIITTDNLDKLKAKYKEDIDAGISVSRPIHVAEDDPISAIWKSLSNQDWDAEVITKISAEDLKEVATKMTTLPDDFTPHRIVQKLYDKRKDITAGEEKIDWGYAENLAYASLLNDGYQVRLSGEDCGRGTFAHRHAVVHDIKTGDSYLSLSHIKEDQKPVRVIDSILSEEAVFGFEYGFASTEPNSLTIWEAQFGDFANGAQVLFDQFISSGETKWGRYCGLVVMLPHGYEGQGPEHSSGRLERYLQLSANNNMRVCMPSTPAQIFHMLRRQVIQKFRKPMIVMTPKSLLRHKLAVNDLSDITDGKFYEVLPEIDNIDNSKVEKLLFCSGKVYYDLLENRRENNQDNIAIIRMEELYPFPSKCYAEEIKKYPNIKEINWVQEEPENQGAWRNILHNLVKYNPIDLEIKYVGRKESASTAAGYASVHKQEQKELVEKALKV